jgi:hypothetical protein
MIGERRVNKKENIQETNQSDSRQLVLARLIQQVANENVERHDQVHHRHKQESIKQVLRRVEHADYRSGKGKLGDEDYALILPKAFFITRKFPTVPGPIPGMKNVHAAEIKGEWVGLPLPRGKPL